MRLFKLVTGQRSADVRLNENGTVAHDATGAAVAKPPNPVAIKQKMEKQCAPDKRKWSDRRYKDHLISVCGNGFKIVEKELVTKPSLIQNRDRVVFGVCDAVLQPISTEWRGEISSHDYANCELG